MLRKTYLFGGVPLDTLKLIAFMCHREYFKPGDTIFSQGEMRRAGILYCFRNHCPLA